VNLAHNTQTIYFVTQLHIAPWMQ